MSPELADDRSLHLRSADGHRLRVVVS